MATASSFLRHGAKHRERIRQRIRDKRRLVEVFPGIMAYEEMFRSLRPGAIYEIKADPAPSPWWRFW